MRWRDDVRLELERARDGERLGNDGRVRTCLRRAIGVAVTEWQRRDAAIHLGRDYIGQLRGLAEDPSAPGEVRDAADRLGSRLGKDFRSRSATPMEDARTVLTYVLTKMGEAPEIN
ncbi:MAG: hypothetical protein MUE68_11955 [Bacteroidetes bacterium]|jgi:hypothetical protein|nr:hypothetical protein [Bacteroidota bacterium]